jgi:hypothetical protein
MNKLHGLFFVIFAVWTNAMAQETLRGAISAEVLARLGNGYRVGSIANLDSLSPAEAYEDPYQTLQGCTIFTVLGGPRADGTSPRGAIGVYRGQQLVWLSDTLVEIDEINDATIRATKDLNNDGMVDIVTAWIYGMRSPIERYWIFSWTGGEGILINALDSTGSSVIKAQEGNLRIVDVNGDGWWELQGRIPDFRNETDSLMTYGWNGSAFVQMQDLGGSRLVAPRDAIICTVQGSVAKSGNELKYEYVVWNSLASQFDLDEFNLGKQSGDFRDGRPSDWEFGVWGARPLVGWQSSDENPLRRGQAQSFSYLSEGIPSIVPYYAQGYNYFLDGAPKDAESQYQDAIGNAVRGTTVGPRDMANQPETSTVLDSLTSYLYQAHALGWIPSSSVLSSYSLLLANARAQVLAGSFVAARVTLASLMSTVERDSAVNLSTEAYALLRFNTEYLLGRLPIGSAPALASLTPGLTLTGSGSFELVVRGTGFSEGASILWNGTACATTFVSSTILKTRIAASATASPINAPVTVRNPDGSTSGQLPFAAVTTLPAPVRPVLECVKKGTGGHYTAWFGYRNENPVAVYIPVGSRNKFTPSPRDRDQPTIFLPGRTVRAFSVTFPGTNLVWTLNGRTSTASKNSSRCH